MNLLKKRLRDFERNSQAAKTCSKPWYTKSKRFLGFHLYRLPLGLGIGFNDIIGDADPESKPYGEYQVTWGEWRKKIRKLCPFQYWLREESMDVFSFARRRFHDWWYELKCYFKPFNVLRLHTLPRTWVDEDRLLTHAMFAVVERFMSEDPASIVDYDPQLDPNSGLSLEEHETWAAPQRLFWKEINEVWDWWQKRDEREKQESEALQICRKKANKLPYKEKYKEMDALGAQFEKEEDEMLQKILKHRHSLWV